MKRDSFLLNTLNVYIKNCVDIFSFKIIYIFLNNKNAYKINKQKNKLKGENPRAKAVKGECKTTFSGVPKMKEENLRSYETICCILMIIAFLLMLMS